MVGFPTLSQCGHGLYGRTSANEMAWSRISMSNGPSPNRLRIAGTYVDERFLRYLGSWKANESSWLMIPLMWKRSVGLWNCWEAGHWSHVAPCQSSSGLSMFLRNWYSEPRGCLIYSQPYSRGNLWDYRVGQPDLLSIDGLIDSIGIDIDAPNGGLCVAYWWKYPTPLYDYEERYLELEWADLFVGIL